MVDVDRDDGGYIDCADVKYVENGFVNCISLRYCRLIKLLRVLKIVTGAELQKRFTSVWGDGFFGEEHKIRVGHPGSMMYWLTCVENERARERGECIVRLQLSSS
ncbi:hypothetical protein K461DRAFT_282225 [Myriangium duriaei CBS 260.36]|uniref:Uncharacterized protein n=1 Tax=Myriangium duriaei CBS 260.36 TaxID=1168546 RepID=A0A9P4IW07_9PEZI|nr:hypothetical protein K461DRAFT_282225 [Myriangium duriaei CBS 260.36]